MSTKCTISYNFPTISPEASHAIPPENQDPNCPEYHLYEEVMEGDAVYLELIDCDFRATPSGIVVRIPNTVWNRIIQTGERYVEKHDESGNDS